MSDIEKLMTPQRRSQIGNPGPLYVAYWHGMAFDVVLENSSTM
jgi:hypothetical protein